MEKTMTEEVRNLVEEVNAEFPIESWRFDEEDFIIYANRTDGRLAALMRVYPEDYIRDEDGGIKVDRGPNGEIDVTPIRGQSDLALGRLMLAAVKSLAETK